MSSQEKHAHNVPLPRACSRRLCRNQKPERETAHDRNRKQVKTLSSGSHSFFSQDMKHHFSRGLGRNKKSQQRTTTCQQKGKRIDDSRKGLSFCVLGLQHNERIHFFVRQEFRLCELQCELIQRFNPMVSWPKRSNSEHANRCHSNGTANQVRTA